MNNEKFIAEEISRLNGLYGVKIPNHGTQFLIKFGLKRRWGGGYKKFAVVADIGNIARHLEQVKNVEGKIFEIS